MGRDNFWLHVVWLSKNYPLGPIGKGKANCPGVLAELKNS